jgi:hypothetical protein
MIQAAGLSVVSIERSKHIKARVQAPDGRQSLQIFPCTPSDQRALLNRRACLRRFARGT